MMSWLKKVGFKDIKLVDVTDTSTEEQRSTEWMSFHSLEQFLDPDDSQKSIEGYQNNRSKSIWIATTAGSSPCGGRVIR